MSKINSTKRVDSRTEVGELAGVLVNDAAKNTPIQALRRVTLANLLWENNAYEDGESTSDAIAKIIPTCDPCDVANLAIECRTKQYLRHTPLFIASEMCKYDNTKPYVANVLKTICTRADMLTDFLAIYWKNSDKKSRPLANVAKKGLAEAFHNFNEYKLAKYDRNTPIKLRDVMFLTHPKARNDDEQNLFCKVANRTLQTPETWEVLLSAGKDKNVTWTKLINENKLGGLAFLRNMRNMMDAGVSRSVIEDGLKKLNNVMLLPLDYYKANVSTKNVFKRQIEDAMLSSYEKLPKLKGKTLFIVDVSGSMGYNLSDKSTFTRYDAAAAAAIVASNQCEDFTLMYTAGRYDEKHVIDNFPPRGFDMMQKVRDVTHEIGSNGIFTRQCLEAAKAELGDNFDRIIVFSDSQDCDFQGNRIPAPFAKNNYIIDVSAHQHGVNYKGVWTAEISGWSEHFLTYINALEGNENAFGE